MDLGQPLKGGFLSRIPPSATKDVQIAAMNEIIDRLNSSLQTQVLADTSTRRMLFGYQKDGWGTGKDFGIKISIEGVDVTTATDDQLLFKMDLATWYWYDPTTLKNVAQIGVLPNGVGGVASAKPDTDVADAYAA